MVVCLEQGADLHTAQLTPLPLTVSCFSKIQIGFTFLVPAHLGSPGKRAVKREWNGSVCHYKWVPSWLSMCQYHIHKHASNALKTVNLAFGPRWKLADWESIIHLRRMRVWSLWHSQFSCKFNVVIRICCWILVWNIECFSPKTYIHKNMENGSNHT